MTDGRLRDVPAISTPVFAAFQFVEHGDGLSQELEHVTTFEYFGLILTGTNLGTSKATTRSSFSISHYGGSYVLTQSGTGSLTCACRLYAARRAFLIGAGMNFRLLEKMSVTGQKYVIRQKQATRPRIFNEKQLGLEFRQLGLTAPCPLVRSWIRVYS